MKELENLPKFSVRVGAFNGNGYMEMIAMVQEYGADIYPKNVQWLTIPTKLAGRKHAKDIPGLFRPKGKNYLAKSNGSGGLDIYFILSKHVHVPERSYLGNTFDNKVRTTWMDIVDDDISAILDSGGRMKATRLYSDLGKQMVKDVKQNIISKDTPPNAAITASRKGKNDPLMDTGGLLHSIGYVVDENN